MSLRILCTLLCFPPIVGICLGNAFCKELTFAQIAEIARDAVAKSQIVIVHPRVDINTERKSIDLTFANAVFPCATAVDSVIQYEIELEIMRTSNGPEFNVKFFQPLIAQAENIVKTKMLSVAYDRELSGQQRTAAVLALQKECDQIFLAAVRRYAQSQGYSVGYSAVAGTHAVKVVAESGVVFEMHLLTWIRIQKEGSNPTTMMTNISNFGSFSSSGAHVLMVKFPGTTFGPAIVSADRVTELHIFPDGQIKYGRE